MPSRFIVHEPIEAYLAKVAEIYKRLPSALTHIVFDYSADDDRGVWRIIYGMKDAAHAALIEHVQLLGGCESGWNAYGPIKKEIVAPAPMVSVDVSMLGADRRADFAELVHSPMLPLSSYRRMSTAGRAQYTLALYAFVCVTQLHLAPESFKRAQDPLYYAPTD